MNAQNIPSHAEDVRHMFRATPERVEYVKGKLDNDVVKAALYNYATVGLPDTTSKMVSELEVGDVIVVQKDNKDTLMQIVSLKPDQNDVAKVELSLEEVEV